MAIRNIITRGYGFGAAIRFVMLRGYTSADAADAGTKILNAGATETRSNYEICPVSGFRQYPRDHELSQFKIRWDGQYARQDSLDPRQPQDDVESGRSAPQEGPQNPEADDQTVPTVTQDDL